MKTLQLNDEKYLLPGNWNELTTEQQLFLIKLVGKNLSAEEIKLKMFLNILNANVHSYNDTDSEMRFIVKIGKLKYDFSAEEIYCITTIFNYLFITDKETGTRSISPMLTKNPFPILKVKGKKLQGAGEGLHDITYEQFILLMTYFSQIQEQPESVNDFIAVLYRKPAEPKLFNKLSPEIKTALIWYYLGSTAFMAEKFPRTFSGTGTSSGRTVFENQMRVVDTLANNDLTKKQIVKNALLYDALFTLEIAAENSENLKK